MDDVCVGSSPIMPPNYTEEVRMDEDTVLKTAERNGFGGSIPFSSAQYNVSMVKRQSHLTVNQVFLVRVQVGTQLVL